MNQRHERAKKELQSVRSEFESYIRNRIPIENLLHYHVSAILWFYEDTQKKFSLLKEQTTDGKQQDLLREIEKNTDHLYLLSKTALQELIQQYEKDITRLADIGEKIVRIES